ncbi:MAG: hypothetical protein CL624_09495 [Arcobacter sp.]|jgi:hypothetical protein|nr:hypothetical protein [Arcobacter sp.]|tara:strand:- start:26883 stop:27155 length:273 start_codon:yes stop_codon:yes gene_type:complete
MNNEKLIKENTTALDFLLRNTNYSVSIYQRSDVYTDCDENDKDYGKALFEAHLEDRETEEVIDDTFTGMYTDIISVIDEIKEIAESFSNE